MILVCLAWSIPCVACLQVVQGHLLCCGGKEDRRWKTFGGDRCCFCKTALVEANGHWPCMMALFSAAKHLLVLNKA
ncbi:hypothetical protein RchiOBHm_Chr6g0274851 [Rosa chinensis]|uniref:Secreted protein n=1 Tax=Rosa chinensis TaxID=74649 RepID=A0A2P6PRU6_ROSCH|nr:hypothetical protein RchiOBHm_Chr6g0274851 [Rosa chinensis]